MKNTRTADFCADRIDVITDFAVITNVVIKRYRIGIRVFAALSGWTDNSTIV